MKKIKKISILLLSMMALTATTACDFSLSKTPETVTPSTDDNSQNTGTNQSSGTNNNDTDNNNTSGNSTDNTGNSTSGNTGGNTSGNTGDSTGGNTGGSTSGNTGDNTGGNTQTTRYTVTFITNGGSSINSQSVESGKTITSVSTTKSGCTFGGWYTDSNFTNSFSLTTPITGATTLYAKWTATVTFNTNSGSAVTAQTVTCGDTISAVTTSRNGYDFAGWYTDPSLTSAFNVTTPITTSIQLYAKWNLKATPGNIISTYAAYNEGAYVVFEVSSATVANNSTVSYSTDSINWTNIDSELIRYDSTSKTARADILGLKAGSYIIKVNNTEKESTTATINVSADDRSGYAQFNTTTGVGAYNTDGTLKSNAGVIYVTDANKNTISYGGKTGLVNILKATRSTPLCVRFLDTIKTVQFNSINYSSSANTDALLTEQANSLGGNKSGYSAADIVSNGWNSYSNDLTNGITQLSGLTSRMMYSSGEFDTYWNMCDISSASNITIEGVGENAGLFQWGFTWSKCNSIEVKNLTFTDYTEDACSFQAGSNSDVTSYGRYWVHNCTFNRGKNNWDLSYEQDKHYGDGATDFKYCNSVTSAYNVFNNCKKTGLVGGSNNNYTMNITFHHNFYNNVGSRLPLGRQANMHIYNNYYYNCSTCQDIRANAFVLSESNYFDGCQNPQKVSTDTTYTGTVIKSYNDYLTGCGSSQATVVTSRDATLSGNCKPDGSTNYTNFDTNTSLFYYDSTNKRSNVSILTDVNNVKTFVPSVAGAGTLANFNIGDFSDINTDVETFTVNFETNGGTSVTSQTVVSGGTISSISTTRSGYTFKGWYTNIGLTNSFNVSTPITSSLTLYAKWEQNSSSSQTSNTTILFNDFTTGSFSTSATLNGATLTPKSGKTSEIKTCTTTTVAGNSISKYVAFGGAGSYSELSIQFTTTATASITIYYAGNVSSGVGRKVALYNTSGLVSTATTETTGAGISNVVSYTFTNVESGNYAITSSNSSIEIYAIVITY